jgi:hypothetical protein
MRHGFGWTRTPAARLRRVPLIGVSVIAACAIGLTIYLRDGGHKEPSRTVANSSATRQRTITDGILGIPLARGWTGSVGPGVQAGHRVAWIIVGDFRFPSDWGPGHREGTPSVPRKRLLIALGDFFPDEYSAHWRRVRKLRLPARIDGRRLVVWKTRYAGRALRLSVQFGSSPDAQTIARANDVLRGVRPL